jgi:hypothetical protein
VTEVRKPERRVCPDDFQHAIDERFGVNRFGTPRYRMAWGETETMRVAGPKGYEDRLLCGNVACWNLMRWRAPESFGSPELFELVNRDPTSGLCLLGEYPYEGRYDVLQPLMAKSFDVDRDPRTGAVYRSKLHVEVFELSWQIIDTILPLIVASGELDELEIAAANAVIEARENKVIVDEITDRMLEEMPTRLGPVSYGKGGCKTAAITKKMDQISQVWNRMSKSALRRPRRGFYQGTPN